MIEENDQLAESYFEGRLGHHFSHHGRLHTLTKHVVLVGIMGAGKTSVGKLLAKKLGINFFDSDVEVELASGYKITDFFDLYGEKAFRDGEAKVIGRLLNNPVPHVISTGGGAYLHPKSRQKINEKSIPIWIRADLETLIKRVSRRNNRPLLDKGNHRDVLSQIMSDRYNTYQEAAIIVDSDTDSPRVTVNRVRVKLCEYLEKNKNDSSD
ncbi:MAG: shikimate kinase [Alphaproteobacteria bacterium]|nr:shikimate kinase [Alphaproteobacteria bacterium]